MPTSEAPTNLDEEQGPAGSGEPPRPEGDAAGSRNGNGLRSSSRWVDYDTHELLEMISELEDERRWARLREGVLWAVLVHIMIILAVVLLPKYFPNLVPRVITSNIKNHKDFTYLDTPYLPKPKVVKPLVRPPQIDQKTLEELRKEQEERAKAAPQPPAPQPPPPPQEQAKVEPTPQPTQPIPPSPKSQSPVEAPKPAAVPAKRPDFSALSQSPVDQLHQAMQNAMRSGGQEQGGNFGGGGLPMHPGAGTGGVQVLSDTQGVDFSAWLRAWHYETERTWDPLIPDEVNPPILKSGMVAIRFKVLPNGRLMDGSLVLEGRSGDVALDRAAWGALTGSSYPPLPKAFHGPYLELRAWFLYNMQPPQ
ncbi:MAG: energy transducer TonB [Acidobacteriota bacterium]